MSSDSQMHLFFEDISTRKGRERYLGIPANQNARIMRERAVKDFRGANPDFVISGDTTDFDGYVQYVFNGQKHCTFYEGVIRCRKARDHFAHELGHDLSFCELTLGNSAISIRDLISENRDLLIKKIEKDKFLINIVLAQIWLDKLFSDASNEADNRSMIKDGVLELIKNQKIPFDSIVDVMDYGYYAEHLVVSKLMLDRGEKPLINDPNIRLSNIELGSFEILKTSNIDYESTPPIKLAVDRWCRYLMIRHNVEINCLLCLGISSWV